MQDTDRRNVCRIQVGGMCEDTGRRNEEVGWHVRIQVQVIRTFFESICVYMQ